MSDDEQTTEQPEEMADSYGRTPTDVQSEKLRRDWGGSDESVRRGIELADLAITRLGVSQREVDEAEKAGPTVQRQKLDELRDLGRGFADLPDDITPELAHEMRADLASDKDFAKRMMAGDAVTKRRWRAINQLAARRNK